MGDRARGGRGGSKKRSKMTIFSGFFGLENADFGLKMLIFGLENADFCQKSLNILILARNL